ncbi:MAG: hypothetical protein IPH02_00710 [Sphingobacteriales bacterium]|nr:hypothetical protein [Sphingobacteriales bacterium]
MQQLAPDHNTIANFRKDNQKAIREVFRHTVRIAKQFQLIGANSLPATRPNFGLKTARKTILMKRK